MKDKWDKVWEGGSRLKISRFNKISFERICHYINLKGLETIELGAGTGALSLLISKYAKSVTLLDYSKSAISNIKHLFKVYNIQNCHFICKDLFKFRPTKKYDVVLSSGLLEHFKGKKQLECLMRHKHLSKKGGYIIIIAPSNNLVNNIRCRMRYFIELFGYQRPISKRKMLELFKSAKITPLAIENFDFTYGLYSLILRLMPLRRKFKKSKCKLRRNNLENLDFYSLKNIHWSLLDRFFGGLIMGIGRNDND